MHARVLLEVTTKWLPHHHPPGAHHDEPRHVGPLTTTVLIAGSPKRARELEAIGFLQLTLAANEKVSWTGGFGVVA